MKDDEQTVVNGSKSGSESPDAERDAQDVYGLLNEYDDQTNQSTNQEKPKQAQSESIADRYARQQMERQYAEETNKDIADAVKRLKDRVDPSLPDDVYEAILYGEASKNSDVLSAFQSRREKSAAWERALENIGEKYSNLIVDRNTTDDRNEVASAVRSASKAPSKEPSLNESDLRKMSDGDFQKLVQETLN